MSESDLKAAILDALHRCGYIAWSNAQGGRRFRTGLGPGSPDIVACIRMDSAAGRAYGLGRFVGLEIKVPGSKPQKHEARQAEWRASANRVGAYVVVVRSVKEAIDAVQAAARGELAPADDATGARRA